MDNSEKLLRAIFGTTDFIGKGLIDKGGGDVKKLYDAFAFAGEALRDGGDPEWVKKKLLSDVTNITGLPVDDLYPLLENAWNFMVSTISKLTQKPKDPCPFDKGNVKIDNLYFYAEDIDFDPPYRKQVAEEVKIEGGLPRHYFKGYELRKVTFTTKVMCPPTEIYKKIAALQNKVCSFSSTFTGAFNCIVSYKVKFPSGTANYAEIEFEVTETTSPLPKGDGKG